MIDFDTSLSPLVVVRCSGYVHEDEVHRYLRAYEGVLESDVPHALLIVARDVSVSGRMTEVLDTISDWVDRRATDWSNQCSACALVLKEPELRRAVDVVGGIDCPGIPAEWFEDGTPAVDWLDERIETETPLTESVRPILDPSLGDGRALQDVRDVAGSEHRDWTPYEEEGTDQTS